MTMLYSSQGTITFPLDAGNTLLINNISGVETVSGSIASREDVSAVFGTGRVGYGPQTSAVTITLSTTGQCDYEIRVGDVSPSRDTVRIDPITGGLDTASMAAMGASGVDIGPRLQTWDESGVSLLGHSYYDNGYTTDATTGVIYATSCRCMADALNQALGHPWVNLSRRCYTGTRTDQWLASNAGVMLYGGYVQALADNSATVLMAGPQNDVNQGISTAVTLANIETMVLGLTSAGKRVWLTVSPYMSSWNGTQQAAMDVCNTGIIALARKYSCPIIDDKTGMGDPSTGMLYAATSIDDGGAVYTHPNGVGAFLSANYNAPILSRYVRPRIFKLEKSLLANSQLLNISAGLPASWAAFASNSGTPTRAAVAGGGWRTTFTASAANGYDGITQTVTLAAAGLAVGDSVRVDALARIIAADGVGVTPRIYCVFTGSTAGYTYSRSNVRIAPDGNILWPTQAIGRQISASARPTIIPAGTTGITINANFEADNGATVTCQWDRVSLIKTN
jgi:hypothetical protein